MADRRQHRGCHPSDPGLFAPAALPVLRRAVDELSWLLGRDYAITAALKLVGDRHRLTRRQRDALHRCACADAARADRTARQLTDAALAGRALAIDGYNVLISVEAALAGGLILVGRDGCYRDLASVHGTFRRVEETAPALERIGALLAELQLTRCTWLLDQPVSNSGRLASQLRALAAARGWLWEVELVPSPDYVLRQGPAVVASADSAVLDGCGAWFALARAVIDAAVPGAWIVDLAG